MTITQNYFKNKYDYFNGKYNIEEIDAVKIKIDPLERLSYAMTHCFPEVFFTFFICMISQFIINFICIGMQLSVILNILKNESIFIIGCFRLKILQYKILKDLLSYLIAFSKVR